MYYMIEFDQPSSMGAKAAQTTAGRCAFWEGGAGKRRLGQDTLVCIVLPSRVNDGPNARVRRDGATEGPPTLVFGTVVKRGKDRTTNAVSLLAHSETRARLGIAPCAPILPRGPHALPLTICASSASFLCTIPPSAASPA